MALSPRHIQNFSEAASLEPHWGYADRAVPCTNDAGSCAYLDQVYGAHDRGMIYTGVMWSIIGSILLLYAIFKHFPSTSNRWVKTLKTSSRRYLLPEFKSLRWLFGHTTRLQVLILFSSVVYLVIFSFAGMEYHRWITPVKKHPGVYNTRTTLGPWSDRVGVLAFALTPLSILLANRESLLSVCTGIPYHHFNFLHRWLGHIIFLQSVLHTIGWCIIEIRLYQPQPEVAITWIKQLYMIWGIVAMILLLVLWALATPWGRRLTGYEFFRKSHYVLAMVYIGACWGHWANLKCFLLPSLLIWFLDRGIRLLRTGLIHYKVLPGGKGMFTALSASITSFEHDVIRLDMDLINPTTWTIGQHFYLTFMEGGIWQSHPFTPLSLPGEKQSYIVRAKYGETKRIARLEKTSTPIILTGPYGEDISRGVSSETNILAIAGGTGISFVLPLLLDIAKKKDHVGKVDLFWVVRSSRHAEWIKGELGDIHSSNLVNIHIHSTGSDSHLSLEPVESGTLTTPSEEKSSNEASQHPGRPDLNLVVTNWIKAFGGGDNLVLVSGPGGMTSDVRDSVASLNRPMGVWKGEEGKSVRLVYDERLE